MAAKPIAAILIPIGPGKETALDTLDSVACYCKEPHVIVIVDDYTQDGTYEAVLAHKRPNWCVLRNTRRMGRLRLVHSLCSSFDFILSEWNCDLVLRLDQDALIIKPGVLSDALFYMRNNPAVGIFGVYERDYNRARSFESHRELITREMSLLKRMVGLRPSWAPFLAMAERQGYRRGDNVFGGAYFITRPCLSELKHIGALRVPYRWHSRMMEDVYFSMTTVAAGFKLGHFAAPDGPLCLEWNGLPYPARDFVESPYKIIHSVDKGANSTSDANCGNTARELFQIIRRNKASQDEQTAHRVTLET